MRKWYELRAHSEGREVRVAPKFLAVLDMEDPDQARRDLTQHVLAAADRNGVTRDRAHTLYLAVHEMRGDRPENRPVYTYALPVEVA
ncbi:hypothetical protein [Melissospora conviva]|uniref:hypothetical protein n=1 Tax=Melissospora conviva TaxID=3388432 RepID=UPI003C204659